MSILGVLNRSDHNNKGAITQDHGTGLFPSHKVLLTPYQMVARIKRATKLTSEFSGGRLVLLELENHPFPPGGDESNETLSEQNPIGLSPFGVSSSLSGLPDVCSISGTENFNGEHSILALDGASGQKSDKRLILSDAVNSPNESEVDSIVEEDVGWIYLAPLSKGERLMDPARVMSHPSFKQREGEGVYTYPFPPDITRNFVYHPATKIDGSVQRTLGTSVLIAQPQVDADIIITESWIGGNRELSTLTEMFRVFWAYWTTLPEPGKALGWEPRDRTGDRFHIQIVQVQLGGLDFEYNEVREFVDRSEGSYLDSQLTVKFKLAKVSRPPIPRITMEGR